MRIGYWVLDIGYSCCKQVGFTIIELLVVISIMATISVIGFASFSSYNNSKQLSIAQLDLKTTLQYARSETGTQVNTCPAGKIFGGYTVVVCCSGNGCPVCLSKNSYEVDIMCGGTNTFVNGKNLPIGVRVDTTKSTSFSYQFAPLTGAVTGAGTVVLTQAGAQKNIVVSSTGVIQ